MCSAEEQQITHDSLFKKIIQLVNKDLKICYFYFIVSFYFLFFNVLVFKFLKNNKLILF